MPPKDPKAECLKKGWKWTGRYCLPPEKHCPKGYIGKPPVCVKVPDKKDCPKGFIGTPPKCKKLPPANCPKGYVGTPPNCRKPPHGKCPKGYIGRPPNCKKVKFNAPADKLKGIKQKLDRLKIDKPKLFKKD